MNKYESWIGVGVKIGGIIGPLGFESLTGNVFNAGNPAYYHRLTISGIRVGLGLGGGGGLVLIFVYNCNNIKSLHNTSSEDWGVNVSFGEKWADVAKVIKNKNLFSTILNLQGVLAYATPDKIENIRNCMAYIYNIYDLSTVAGAPKIISIDIPGAGIGEELSAYYLTGEIIIGDEEIADQRSPDEA